MIDDEVPKNLLEKVKLTGFGDVVVTVAGPGLTINNKVNIIAQALRDYGFTVEEVNNHPAPWLVRPALDDPFIRGDAKHGKIVLVANHLPWGG